MFMTYHLECMLSCVILPTQLLGEIPGAAILGYRRCGVAHLW